MLLEDWLRYLIFWSPLLHSERSQTGHPPGTAPESSLRQAPSCISSRLGISNLFIGGLRQTSFKRTDVFWHKPSAKIQEEICSWRVLCCSALMKQLFVWLISHSNVAHSSKASRNGEKNAVRLPRLNFQWATNQHGLALDIVWFFRAWSPIGRSKTSGIWWIFIRNWTYEAEPDASSVYICVYEIRCR